MKNIVALFLSITLMFTVTQLAYADNNEYSDLRLFPEEIQQLHFNPSVRSYGKYYYATSDQVEIQHIIHKINSFHLEAGNIPVLPDNDNYYVGINYKNGTYRNILLSPSGILIDDKAYWIEEYEYERFLEFIRALKMGELRFSQFTSKCSEWAQIDIHFSEKNIIEKWNQFNYNEFVTRLEVCQLISSFVKKQTSSLNVYTHSPFDDTNDVAVSLTYSLGIINGKAENIFMPYDLITREEMAKILCNLWHYINSDLTIDVQESNYKDCDKISDWAKVFVDEMSTLGILKGDENGNFSPQRHMTKEEVIVSLMRLF